MNEILTEGKEVPPPPPKKVVDSTVSLELSYEYFICIYIHFHFLYNISSDKRMYGMLEF